MNNPFSLEGKTILVTGASSGIGRSVAIVCSGMGAKVVLTARSEKRLQDTMSLLEGQGHRYICADLTNQKDVVNLVSSLPELCGIVHCAGLMKRVPCKMINHDSFSSVFSLNLEAQILLQANLLQEKKISKGGSIVFISSFAAHSAVSGNSLYSASKAALISYANCLALEVAPRRLRVNCVCPAMVWTELVYEGASQEELEYDQNTYPLGRYGKPEDIANLVVYLLSDASVWMTGSCLNITGGK